MTNARVSTRFFAGMEARTTDGSDTPKARRAFTTWYYGGDNRKKLSTKRRDEYANNPEYREACLARSRAYRERRKSGGHTPVSTPPRPHRVKYRGRWRNAWTIRIFATRISRNTKTIYAWLSGDLLPTTPLTSTGGHRLYTDEMIAAVADVLEEFISIVHSSTDFYGRVLELWTALGIYNCTQCGSGETEKGIFLDGRLRCQSCEKDSKAKRIARKRAA